MSTSLVQVEGAIIFRVTDLQLAIRIDELVKSHDRWISDHVALSKKQNANGKAKRGANSEERIWNLLKERYGSESFPTGETREAAILVMKALEVKIGTFRNAINAAKEKGILVSDKKGYVHFLGSAMTQDLPAIGT